VEEYLQGGKHTTKTNRSKLSGYLTGTTVPIRRKDDCKGSKEASCTSRSIPTWSQMNSNHAGHLIGGKLYYKGSVTNKLDYNATKLMYKKNKDTLLPETGEGDSHTYRRIPPRSQECNLDEYHPNGGYRFTDCSNRHCKGSK